METDKITQSQRFERVDAGNTRIELTATAESDLPQIMERVLSFATDRIEAAKDPQRCAEVRKSVAMVFKMSEALALLLDSDPKYRYDQGLTVKGFFACIHLSHGIVVTWESTD